MPPPFILIVGSGIAGTTLASFLLLAPIPAAQEPRITILERASHPRAQGQNIDIRGAGVAIIRKLGLECAIKANTTGEEGVHFVDEQNRLVAVGPADKTGKVQTGTSDIEILRGTLADICYRRCRTISDDVQSKGAAGVDFIFGDYLDSITQASPDGVEVHFAKRNETRSYDLVIGADGLQSSTRALVWGTTADREAVRSLDMYGGFFSMPSGPTDSEWRRWFIPPGRKGVMVRPSGSKDRVTVFMYCINSTDQRFSEVAEGGRKSVEAQKALFAEYFADAGWESTRLIREMNEAEDFYYSPVAQVKLDEWSKNRVVLLDDAAFCASPISGMGTTLAFTGAHNLAGSLVEHVLSQPEEKKGWGNALSQYETLTRPVVEKAQTLPFGGQGIKVLHFESWWAVWIFRTSIWAMAISGVFGILSKWKGPPADDVKVEAFEFEKVEELTRS
ncbi:hypothetical protein B0A48_14946 [Cryoendolithus antarcticus]|uniref:FAD-binding domain-containing protein n=1 Tax=Cryoendolithus antarcticus TaxID=1507870 RepID=A0A1V8SIW4_9PEZI|nr:hypothetical protein B0A48_14946 [Cryoendolithus antarcticus]